MISDFSLTPSVILLFTASKVTSYLRVIEIIQALSMIHYYDCLAGLLSPPLHLLETMGAQPEINAATWDHTYWHNITSLTANSTSLCSLINILQLNQMHILVKSTPKSKKYLFLSTCLCVKHQNIGSCPEQLLEVLVVTDLLYERRHLHCLENWQQPYLKKHIQTRL